MLTFVCLKYNDRFWIKYCYIYVYVLVFLHAHLKSAHLDILFSIIIMQGKQLMNHLCINLFNSVLCIIFFSRYMSQYVTVHCIEIIFHSFLWMWSLIVVNNESISVTEQCCYFIPCPKIFLICNFTNTVYPRTPYYSRVPPTLVDNSTEKFRIKKVKKIIKMFICKVYILINCFSIQHE